MADETHIRLQQLLDETVRAITIHSPTSYSWFGERSVTLSRKVRATLISREARQYLLYALTSRLYSDFYLSGSPASSQPEAQNHFHRYLTGFAAELSAVNCGTGYWEPDWKVRSVANSTIAVCRGGITIWLRQQECLALGTGGIVPGSIVSARFPKEFLGMSPGFYMALGNSPLLADRGQILIRIYWNLCSEGAIPFVKIASQLFNQTAFPFRLKVLNDRSLFRRCDAGVIYLMKEDYPTIADALSTIYRDIAKYLKPETPVFTKQLSPGVGLAEDPGGESFGQHRCRLLADAVIRAHEEGKTTVKQKITFITDHFHAHGIELARPFLNPGSKDEYEPPPGFSWPNAIQVSETSSGARLFLDTADELGRRLSKDAVWAGNQCNWLGLEPLSRFQDRLGPVYKPLGSTLYSGTSGIALFLAELYTISGSSEVHRTAVGAARHAINHFPQESVGLYTGMLGVALAAARVGILLDEQELLDRASQRIKEGSEEGKIPEEFDLLSGCAGAIVACLLLGEMLQEESLLGIAARIADELFQRAERSHAGYSWSSPTLNHQRNLTGLSHGTAGVAYALLELFSVSADPKHRALAEQAFEYERYWFDGEKRNWPDFRDDRNNPRQQRPLRFVNFWCHGAPGIGLTRLRAFQITGDELCKQEAIIALNTTHTALHTALSTRTENFSLCHGLAGNAEVLLYGREILGAKWAEKSNLAFEIARHGVDVSKERGGAWACGLDRGETPALMLGLAGIGYFYLRLHDPTIPSLVIPRREQFCSGRT